MLKTTKRYIITTNALNSQGFRVLSEGIDWKQYKGNSVMLYMHYRPTGANKDEVRALGNVREIETDADGVVTGQPYFNDKYEFARDIYEGYENGTYNMLSLGTFPTEFSAEPEHLIEGQVYPTVTKSIAKEISCVDIGSNAEALGVALYDKQGGLITLSDNLIIQPLNIEKMKLITLSADTMGLLKLADGSTPEAAHTAVQALVTLSDKQKTDIEALTAEKTNLTVEATKLKTDLDAAVKLADSEKLIALVDKAIDVDRKITADLKEDYIKLGYDAAKGILDKMKPNPSITSQIENDASKSVDPDYVKLSYSELDQKGKLIKLKADNFELFKTKFKEKYDTEYKGAQ